MGDGWLHLSGTGFQIHPRTGKLRHYRWCEIDEFMRVESRDEDGGLVVQVGFRFAPRRHRSPRDKLRSALAPCDSDGTKSDGVLDGPWNRSVDDAVDLMNAWLARSRVNL